MKKKTHKEYVSELATKNPNVEVVEKYIDAKTKILHRCIKHNVYWKSLPSNVISGKGCKECRFEKTKEKNIKLNDEYIKEVEKINPNIIPLEDYIGSNTPILHLCKKHNIEWKAFPNNILKGYGCVECGKEKIHIHTQNRHEDYVSKLKIINPNVEVIGQYRGKNIKILHRCLIHDILWEVTPNGALSGNGCKMCHKEKIGNANRKTQEQYINEVKLVNKDIVVLGDYVNMSTPILHKCIKHNVEWIAYPSGILKGCGCYMCGNEKVSITSRKEHIEYLKELNTKNPYISVIDTYINMKTPIKHRCEIHNYEWETTPSSVLLGCGCPKCRSDKISKKVRKNHDEYVDKLKSINPKIEVIGTYINYSTPILHKCLIDGNEWYGVPSYILAGTGCPKCNESKGEREIRLWLERHNISFEQQKRYADCCDKRTLPFDFYLPDYNAVIEYNGIQHYKATDYFGGDKSLKYIQSHDKIKETYCRDNNIKFLCIPYTKNIETELNNFIYLT